MTDPLPNPTRVSARTKADIRGILAQLGPKTDLGRARRALLPGWIKFFSWLFLLVAGGVPVGVVTGIVTGRSITFSLFGIHYQGAVLDLEAVLLAVAILSCGTTAYGLLWGRSWGVFAGTLTGWCGLALSVTSIFVNRPGLHVPLEPLLLIPFLVKLSALRPRWNEAAGD